MSTRHTVTALPCASAHIRKRVPALLLAGALLAGCAQESTSEEDRSCATALVLDQTFSIPQNPGDRSFQGHATFDGQAIWLTHAHAPAGEESIVVSALRAHCDGSIATPATRVPEQSGLQTEPRITSSNQTVLLAWQRDDQISAQNLSTYYMTFDREQGIAAEPARHLDTRYQDEPAGNTWMPQLSASDASFAIAGLRGVSDFQTFQSYVQRLDHDGNMTGAAMNGQLQDERSQDSVSALLLADDSILLAHSQTDADGQSRVVHQRLEDGADLPTGEPVLASRELSAMPSQGGSHDHGRFMVFTTEGGGIGIKPSDLFDPDAPVLLLREEGGSPLTPRLAVGPSGGLAAWLEPGTGYGAEIRVQGFSTTGSAMQRSGPDLTIPTDAPAIAPYGIDIAHLQDGVYMVTWTEGPIADLQVKWRLLRGAD